MPAVSAIGDPEPLLGGLIELRGEEVGGPADSARGYDGLHSQGRLRQRDSFYLWLLSILRPRPGQALLDISCGQGGLLRAASGAGLDVSGLDLSAAAAALARRDVPLARVAVADAERLPYRSAAFDYVANIGSLEHYFRPHLAIREMARVLRPGGLALVLVPNTFGLLGNILHVWRHGDVHDDGQPLQRYGTRLQWQRLLTGNGLEVLRLLRYERALPRNWPDLLWYGLRPHRLARALLAPLIPANLASFLVYLCRRAPA